MQDENQLTEVHLENGHSTEVVCVLNKYVHECNKNEQFTHSENCDQFWNRCIWHQLIPEHTNCCMTQVVIRSNATKCRRRQTVIILHTKQLIRSKLPHKRQPTQGSEPQGNL